MTTAPARFRSRVVLAALPSVLAGCEGIQSTLAPQGAEASEIAHLFWMVTWLSVVVLALVILLTAVALWGPPRWRIELSRERVVIGGGIVFPVVVLSFLLGYGLLVLQAGAARMEQPTGPGITIVGKRWWWKVIHTGPNGEDVVSANELRLPVGQRVAVRLESDNVIHSFWAPQLAGKLDMIPGRTNVLTVEATEPGITRGQCAEYCGGAHALMAFYVVALPPEDYAAWLAREAGPARTPTTEVQRLGLDLFLANGCPACHTVRGTGAKGTIGPDLTHVGGRMSLAAAALPNDPAAFARWIRDNQHVKPENLMPRYETFAPDELAALAAYLDSLE